MQSFPSKEVYVHTAAAESSEISLGFKATWGIYHNGKITIVTNHPKPETPQPHTYRDIPQYTEHMWTLIQSQNINPHS